MKMVEVNTALLAQDFVAINAQLNQGNPKYIRPLNKEVEEVFDKTKNKLFQQGNAKRWLLQNEQGETIGRIAAFYYSSYKNKGTAYPVGCVGFFDCINDFTATKLLFDTAKAWLLENGMQAMDG
ncbi:MAG: hypothetical protein WCJ68_07345, partial [Chitinophagia bacterium]